MAVHGKHAIESQLVRVGKHGVVARPQVVRVPAWLVGLVVLAVIAACLVPAIFSGGSRAADTGQAFADSTRDAFTQLSDAAAHAEPQLVVEDADYTSSVGPKLQNTFMSGGCEIVALGIVLESMGYDIDLHAFVEDFLDVDGHFATGYSGSPYAQGGGYPPGIVAAANGYLAEQGSPQRAHDITGASFDELRTLVDSGHPVLVWSTMGFDDPYFNGTYDKGVEWYDNEHCVVLYGFDGEDALVSDPLEGLVVRDAARFADIFAECGSMAAVVY